MATITRTSDRDRERIRRSALTRDQGPNEEQQSAGGYPYDLLVKVLAGQPEDPTNISFQFRRQIRRDHMVSLGLHLIAMGLLKAQWYFECDSARVAAFADNLIRPIYGRLILTVLRYLWAGYSPAVKNFETINPNWTFREDGISKKVWDTPNVDALVYRSITPLKPEHCRPDFANGQFSGIKYDERYGTGFFIIDGQRKRKIDLTHSIWATHGLEGEDNNLYGFPRVAHVAPIHHMYWWIWSMIGRGFENTFDPGPVMRYPADELAQAITDDEGNQISNVDTALKIGRRRRSGSTVALPSVSYTDFQDRPSGNKKWDIDYPKAETDFSAGIEWIGFLEALKLRAMWIPEQGVIDAPGGGNARNVAGEFSDLRDESQLVLMREIDEQIIENILVKPAIAMNFPNFEGTIKKRTIGLSKTEEDFVHQIFQLVGQADWRHFGIDVKKLAESRGYPMNDAAEQERIEREMAAQVEGGTTPPVTPTQGRRALVTQTGFGEWEYHQLEAPIHLSEDGDFVAGLPKTPHFADSTVVAASRELRKYARNYYKAIYDDFARHVARQKSLTLSSDQFADEDERTERIIDRLISSWKPRTERITRFAERARNALSKVFTRTAGLQLKNLGSQERIDASNKIAADWLSERGARMIKDVEVTLRDELRDFLAREVRLGSSTDELASKIREEFSQWPEWKADRLARTETSTAFNFATLTAGKSAGIKQVQILDGQNDEPCKKRNGKIVSIADALKEDLAHPNCTLGFRLLAAEGLEIVRAPTEDGLLARFDEESSVILFSPDISSEDETKYLLAVGEALAA